MQGWQNCSSAIKNDGKLIMGSDKLAAKAVEVVASGDPFISMFTIFVLAIFIGFYVVWSVTPALHSPIFGV